MGNGLTDVCNDHERAGLKLVTRGRGDRWLRMGLTTDATLL